MCSNLFIGNVCRYCRGHEPPRPSRVDRCGTVQLKFRGRDIAFHPATFYLSIADYLAREVDGVRPGPEEDPWDASSERDDCER